MAQLEPLALQIQAAGASLVYVAAEKRAGFFKPGQFLAQHPVSFPFLLDEDRAVTKAYGVYHRLGKDAINIARPATFVVDGRSIVRLVYVGAQQTDRAPAEDIMRALREAAKIQQLSNLGIE